MIEVLDIKTIVIAGSGIMGASFAQIFARNGYEVVLYDISLEALRRAKELIRINLDAQVEANSFSKEEAEAIFGRIQMTESKVCFGKADFVLEAIAEKIEIKHSFWKEISSLVRSDVILTSNTSGLSISEIAKAVIHPERFAGMHWVNPPHLIPLVEVIAGEQSSAEVVDKICELAKHIGQKPVKVQKDPTGFILNRLQYAVIREACYCVEKGYASVEDVDRVMKYGLGMRYACIGPFETMDFGNIETFHHVANYIYNDLCADKKAPKLLEQVYQDGKLGVKSGAGFYDYFGDKAEKALKERDAKFIRVSQALFGKQNEGD